MQDLKRIYVALEDHPRAKEVIQKLEVELGSLSKVNQKKAFTDVFIKGMFALKPEAYSEIRESYLSMRDKEAIFVEQYNKKHGTNLTKEQIRVKLYEEALMLPEAPQVQ